MCCLFQFPVRLFVLDYEVLGPGTAVWYIFSTLPGGRKISKCLLGEKRDSSLDD